MGSWRYRSSVAILLVMVAQGLTAASLPRRLVVAIDGIAYRDIAALQQQGSFSNYFPASRLISTFPSASDVAWTEIFGNRALPGYQPAYFNTAANRKIIGNALTSSPQYQDQATWRLRSSFHFAMSYIRPVHEFEHELDRMLDAFLSARAVENFYALILSTDSAQHMGADIVAMLLALDSRLSDLDAKYRAREGSDLEILILSDHANNHAGRGRRILVKQCLKRAGYRIARSILSSRDVVLPTVGIQSWVELHNAPGETERLVQTLSRLDGVDIITARCPDRQGAFLVADSKGNRAIIDAKEIPEPNGAGPSPSLLLRYTPSSGDPLGYLPILQTLRRSGSPAPPDAADFFPAGSWQAETLIHRYPVALKRIIRGHTQLVQNPATILISLDNRFVHAGWWVHAGSKLMKSGGTHGALDDLNSTGMLLSNFAPTRDTTSTQVAADYQGFPGLRDTRQGQQGAEWVSGQGQTLAAISRGPVDWGRQALDPHEVFLHVWSPRFGLEAAEPAIEITLSEVVRFPAAIVKRSDLAPAKARERRYVVRNYVPLAGDPSYERLYPVPDGMRLKPLKQYRMTAVLGAGTTPRPELRFKFYSDASGRPVPYLTITEN